MHFAVNQAAAAQLSELSRSLGRRALGVAGILGSVYRLRKARTDRRAIPGACGSSQRGRKWRRGPPLGRYSRLGPSANPNIPVYRHSTLARRVICLRTATGRSGVDRRCGLRFRFWRDLGVRGVSLDLGVKLSEAGGARFYYRFWAFFLHKANTLQVRSACCQDRDYSEISQR